MKKRQILSASISAEALSVLEERQKSRIQFEITDILNQKPSPTLGPLSLPRPSRNVDLNPPAAPKSTKKDRLSMQNTTSLGEYAERLEQAENTELFSYASTLCHRVTGKYLPRSVLQSDPEAQQRELERIQNDPELLRAIDSVRVLSAQFKDVAQTTMGHRKELGHTLFRIEESYLKLFEKLLELSLRLYWEYENRTEAQRREDRTSIEHWREQYERKCVENGKLNKKMAAREIIHRTREIELQDYQGQMKEIEKELGSQRELESQIFQLQNTAALQQVLERKLREDFAHLTKTHEDMVEYQKQLQEDVGNSHSFAKRFYKGLISFCEATNPAQATRHRPQILGRRSVKEKDRFISKQEVTLRQLEEIASATPVSCESHSTQTEVDDDGLWDVQDGIPRFVSKSATHKMMWRRFNAFVSCKNCGGRPIPKALKTNPFGQTSSDNNEEIDIWSVEKGKKHTKKAARRIERIEQQWELPSHTVLFLSNLPKSVVAFPFYSLENVISRIEAIYDDKFVSDRADEADGAPREELTHGLRQSAEVGLYRFLVSVKNTYQKNSHIRLFTRLSNLLKSDDEDSDNLETSPPTSSPTKRNPIKGSETEAESDLKHVKRSKYLDRSFLHVFLEARHYLLRPPPRAAPKTKKSHKKEGETMEATEHVIQVEPTKTWVPLDHAITVLRWYISCLPEDSIALYCRQVEHSTAIYDGRTITEIAGNRLAVRAEMRRVMLVNESPEAMSTAETSKGRPRPSPRIVADVHKVLKLLMDALEQRREGIKNDLTTLFDAGDTNHDCVLTLEEFSAIIRKRKPHFSDRRILRMFREALMGGTEQSFALSMEAFVVVCNDHGLVSLLPDDRMVDPFAQTIPETRGKAKPLQPPDTMVNEEITPAVLLDVPNDIPSELSSVEIEEDQAMESDTGILQEVAK
ncbi:hypothetical protein P3T76_009313 [Phytophthora citrophthora]|uniref:EF-hand domain-containing protein n=1 Tax=Phytophthora citrophthora TaxID=4793 RepID=A0AAD9GHA7_9STRA|nr:hypothetical protein P3T76_009313 [Phytophthora citrophthora]